MTCRTGVGPLAGIRVVELGGLGPGPFACMLLADLGADVVRIDRSGAGFEMPLPPELDTLQRGKARISVDLKDPVALDEVLALIDQADALVDPYRPGAAERLGLGPEVLLERNPRLVYGRMTGWGQTGPLAQRAGHDPNYLSATGALHAIGRAGGPPQLPLSLVGDFGGGAMYLVTGILAALVERSVSGRGQVVDAAIVDGVAHLMANPYSLLAAGVWRDERGANLIDSGAPFVDVYETADGEYMSVAALESPFYAQLIDGLDLAAAGLPGQWSQHEWPALRAAFSAAFKTRTRDEWAQIFDGTDACVAPVLSMSEAPQGEHLAARGTFIDRDGRPEPAPAPRFDRTPAGVPASPVTPGHGSVSELLERWGAAIPHPA